MPSYLGRWGVTTPVGEGPEDQPINTSYDSESDRREYGFPVGSVFRAARDAVIVMDAGGKLRDINPAGEQLFGYTRDEVLGQGVAELVIPGPLRDAHRNALARYLETGESTILDRRLELSALRRDGTEFPIELAVTRLPGSDAPLFAGFIRDLQEISLARRENLRLQQRMAFLAQAGLVLDSSLEFDQTLHQLAELAVPELAQIAVVDLLEQSGVIKTAVAAASNPADARAVERMRREHPLRLDGPHPVAEVLRTGRATLHPAMSPEFQHDIAQGPEHFELMRTLRYHSAIVVPLVARQRVLGTLSLLRVEDAEPFSESDLVLAEELARRAALAVDNARLFEATRGLAQTLQQSLLPRRLPDIPGIQLTARYRAAAQGQEVGGDFYDVFTIGDGYWGIAIGDVTGKGPEAAALTSLARYSLRGMAARDPAVALWMLNDSVIRESPRVSEQLMTVLFAVAELQEDDLVLDFACAGHPPPLLIHRDGEVERLSVAGPLIGLTSAPEYRSAQVRLRPGETLLLYTDGLTDARAPARMLDEGQLIELIKRARDLSGEELTRFLEHDVTDGKDPRDDIAILVLARDLARLPGAASPGRRVNPGRV
ncbi:MAG TPA: SpoIIE family protein phosphatase [Solirubrobacteraceae bacterium]|nr:SpoIIE family protein phosphatase [Solirubrobacteraceae bacterium]